MSGHSPPQGLPFFFLATTVSFIGDGCMVSIRLAGISVANTYDPDHRALSVNEENAVTELETSSLGATLL